MDYRDALRAKGLKPMTDTARGRLRTARAEGDVEVTRGGLLRHVGAGLVEAA
jgi:hypothetical protein